MTKNTLLKMLWILLATFFLTTVLDAAGKMKPLRLEGVAVAGDIDKFVKKLAKGGFLVTETREDEVRMVGCWEGRPGARVSIRCGRSGREVESVTVDVDGSSDWEPLAAQYDAIVSELGAKFGDTAEAVSSFGEGAVNNDTGRILRVIAGKNDHHTSWNLKGGAVVTSLLHEDGRFLIRTRYLVDVKF